MERGDLSPNLKRESIKDAIIEYIEPDNILYFLFRGTSAELDLLGSEIEKYNDWINNFLIQGFAPEASYGEDRKDMIDALLIKNDKRYQEFFPRSGFRNIYEIHKQQHGFDIIYLHDIEKNYVDVDVVKDLLESYTSADFQIEDMSTLEEIITNPWENTFGMGYRILPITKLLMERK